VPARRSPSVRGRRLGLELRRLREVAGLTIEQVAATLECSDSKISRIETGQVSATPRDVRDILDIYQIRGQQRDWLIQLARESRQKGWWHKEYHDLPISNLVGLEDAATLIRAYRELVVPGWLQTEAYARAVIRAILIDRPHEVERRVKLRMTQQEKLLGNATKDGSPALWAILDEAVLRRSIGGSSVMRKQLEHLGEAATLPHVNLQVLPFEKGAHAGLDGGFTIVGFEQVGDPDVVYLEHTTSDLYLEDSKSINRYDLLFKDLQATALDLKSSIEFLGKVAEDPIEKER
jgi:transcriptional regulator with XRE-family HTH domain